MKIASLAGGVGGAKLAQGLASVLDPEELVVIVNTGDDFKYHGLYISPDIDTVCYTLAGLTNDNTGWGLKDETFKAYQEMSRLDETDWFTLGDKDLATHIIRTEKLNQGESLTNITHNFCRTWGIDHRILPMTDDPVSTMINTVEKGLLTFQEYFVKDHFLSKVKNFYFDGIEKALPTQQVLDAIMACDAVVICPSNPFLSIDPILAIKGIKPLLEKKFVLAVSPIVGGKAIKGPLAKIFNELNIEPSAYAIADHYKNFLDCLFIDNVDFGKFDKKNQSGIIFHGSDIFIPNFESRKRLAMEIVTFFQKTI